MRLNYDAPELPVRSPKKLAPASGSGEGKCRPGAGTTSLQLSRPKAPAYQDEPTLQINRSGPKTPQWTAEPAMSLATEQLGAPDLPIGFGKPSVQTKRRAPELPIRARDASALSRGSRDDKWPR